MSAVHEHLVDSIRRNPPTPEAIGAIIISNMLLWEMLPPEAQDYAAIQTPWLKEVCEASQELVAAARERAGVVDDAG